jgi:hypothetical protein
MSHDKQTDNCEAAPAVDTSIKKERGRPATGLGVQIGARWPAEIVRKIDLWRKVEPGQPNRAKAIRRLVELGLKAKGK